MRTFTEEHRRKLSLAHKGKSPARPWYNADQTLIDEYLNEMNEDHSLEMTAFSYLDRMVSHHFKGKNWSKSSRKVAVHNWMEQNTMSPKALSKTMQGFGRDMSFSKTPEYKEKLRVAALNRWAKQKEESAKHLL